MAPSTKTAADFTETTSLKQILNISDEAMDQAMDIAYRLYLTGRFAEAEIVCKGLIGCDHRHWWSHSLHASILRRTGRSEAALRAVEEGLRYQPGQPKLLLMRLELCAVLDASSSSSTAAAATPSDGQQSVQRPNTTSSPTI